MGTTTPNMGIYVPVDGETNYGQSFLDGMVNIDQHDHSGAPNKGVPLATTGIADGAVTYQKLNSNVADTSTGIGTNAGMANQLILLGLVKSLFQLGTDGIVVNTGGVATTIPYSTNTWTPTISIGGSSVGITYSNQLGGYTQIGNVVCIWFNIVLSSTGGLTGVVRLSNLPISTGTLGTSQTIPLGEYINIIKANGTGIGLRLPSSSTIGNFIVSSIIDGTRSALDDTMISNTTGFQTVGLYITD
jgi:hypothetical protein